MLDDGTTLPGIIKTGVRDTTKAQVVRSVYVDDDGIAKVNVVVPMGIGPFYNSKVDKGYNLCAIFSYY